ncbi:hypothetical protein JZ751_029843 [Albula glossodonta]|uniref:Uncharacterized protein n=1 Tax=Albula glossodonta TaxID=121402 RepID=A0A8T2N9Q2_9TELE|nr:hypothetical protein JZ751_029843 [Albula glossodonta]
MMGCCLFVHHRKKRKQRRREVDSLSLCSLDINGADEESVSPSRTGNPNNNTSSNQGDQGPVLRQTAALTAD